MHLRPALPPDLPRWLILAREVEPTFGPMVEIPEFREGLLGAMERGESWCLDQPGASEAEPLAGGIVISKSANEILWLAVASAYQGRGGGRVLLACAIEELDPEQPLLVTTFAAEVEEGRAARALYHAFGFRDDHNGEINPAGLPTVVMVRPAGMTGGRDVIPFPTSSK